MSSIFVGPHASAVQSARIANLSAYGIPINTLEEDMENRIQK